MGKIFSPPKEIEDPPKFFLNYKDYEKAAKEWQNKLRTWCTSISDDKYAGEIVYESVADGQALYMVLSLKPVQLIHIPLFDAWEFQWAHRWTASDIKKMIKRRKVLENIFSRSNDAGVA